jgi:hypothetical protein
VRQGPWKFANVRGDCHSVSHSTYDCDGKMVRGRKRSSRSACLRVASVQKLPGIASKWAEWTEEHHDPAETPVSGQLDHVDSVQDLGAVLIDNHPAVPGKAVVLVHLGRDVDPRTGKSLREPAHPVDDRVTPGEATAGFDQLARIAQRCFQEAAARGGISPEFGHLASVNEIATS